MKHNIVSLGAEMTSNIHVVEINQTNINIFNNLAQAYEAEFSSLTHSLPNESGIFSITKLPYKPYIGYLLYRQNIPIGFCVINTENKIRDIAEFYIIPSMRKNKFGYQFAVMMFEKYPGEWQARQLVTAENSINFCRSVIKKYTNNKYKESQVPDVDWGTVILQRFNTSCRK